MEKGEGRPYIYIFILFLSSSLSPLFYSFLSLSLSLSPLSLTLSLSAPNPPLPPSPPPLFLYFFLSPSSLPSSSSPPLYLLSSLRPLPSSSLSPSSLPLPLCPSSLWQQRCNSLTNKTVNKKIIIGQKKIRNTDWLILAEKRVWRGEPAIMWREGRRRQNRPPRPPLGGGGPPSIYFRATGRLYTTTHCKSELPCHEHWIAIKTPNPKWPLARVASWPKMPQST